MLIKLPPVHEVILVDGGSVVVSSLSVDGRIDARSNEPRERDREWPGGRRDGPRTVDLVSVLAVMLGVMLARLAGMVRGVRRMTVRRMGVMRGLFGGVGVMMLGCLAMVLGGVLVMLGCGVMMLDDLFFGHDDLREGGRRCRLGRRARLP